MILRSIKIKPATLEGPRTGEKYSTKFGYVGFVVKKRKGKGVPVYAQLLWGVISNDEIESQVPWKASLEYSST